MTDAFAPKVFFPVMQVHVNLKATVLKLRTSQLEVPEDQPITGSHSTFQTTNALCMDLLHLHPNDTSGTFSHRPAELEVSGQAKTKQLTLIHSINPANKRQECQK